jgi:hypothetical protein
VWDLGFLLGRCWLETFLLLLLAIQGRFPILSCCFFGKNGMGQDGSRRWVVIYNRKELVNARLFISLEASILQKCMA